MITDALSSRMPVEQLLKPNLCGDEVWLKQGSISGRTNSPNHLPYSSVHTALYLHIRNWQHRSMLRGKPFPCSLDAILMETNCLGLTPCCLRGSRHCNPTLPTPPKRYISTHIRPFLLTTSELQLHPQALPSQWGPGTFYGGLKEG